MSEQETSLKTHQLSLVTPLEPRVYFIGAGPGDPDLMTVKGRRILEAADVIVYADSLVSEDHCRFAKPGAAIYPSAALTLEQIAAVLIESVRAGKSVARLQSGDPSIYGAIHEQITCLRQAGVPYEIVPGVSSAFAAAARIGAELTIPAVSQTVMLTRLAHRTRGPNRAELRALAGQPGTLVLFLSASVVNRVVEELLAGGRSPQTPCVVGYKVTWPDEIILRGTLATIGDQVRRAKFTKQAIILVGEAVADQGTEGLRSSLYDPAHTHLFRSSEFRVSSSESPSRAENIPPPDRQGVEATSPPSLPAQARRTVAKQTANKQPPLAPAEAGNKQSPLPLGEG